LFVVGCGGVVAAWLLWVWLWLLLLLRWLLAVPLCAGYAGSES
jgi:hypothetical protein